MEKIISLFNQAGGVGKTTLTHNLGCELVERGNRVLFIDIDPQGSLTDFCGVDSADIEETISTPILNRGKNNGVPCELPILSTECGVDLVPASPFLAIEEHSINSLWARELQLKGVLESAEGLHYDFILLDCPPSLGIFSSLALVASTHVLIPVQTQYKALRGTQAALEIIHRVKNSFNPELKILGFVPNMYDSRRNMDQRALGIMNNELPKFAPVLNVIPTATAFAEASGQHRALVQYVKKHVALEPLRLLTDLIEGRGNDLKSVVGE